MLLLLSLVPVRLGRNSPMNHDLLGTVLTCAVTFTLVGGGFALAIAMVGLVP